ncbi:hypothetical protein AAFF_G00042410 [Aldrovandia affinis]|uniref:Uncharacterized protein n=1 Tax=Aldrovandia affinis TaxID=143900 RepID=A0AAD7WF78_9TELE|nr:hypothetical protein AAFF_G00042410 [Aldrovandia affinis]
MKPEGGTSAVWAELVYVGGRGLVVGCEGRGGATLRRSGPVLRLTPIISRSTPIPLKERSGTAYRDKAKHRGLPRHISRPAWGGTPAPPVECFQKALLGRADPQQPGHCSCANTSRTRACATLPTGAPTGPSGTTPRLVIRRAGVRRSLGARTRDPPLVAPPCRVTGGMRSLARHRGPCFVIFVAHTADAKSISTKLQTPAPEWPAGPQTGKPHSCGGKNVDYTDNISSRPRRGGKRKKNEASSLTFVPFLRPCLRHSHWRSLSSRCHGPSLGECGVFAVTGLSSRERKEIRITP